MSYRCTDDLIARNGKDIVKHLHNIHTTFIRFKEFNQSNSDTDGLYLNIKTNDKIINAFIKRRDYKFQGCDLPNHTSNMKIAYIPLYLATEKIDIYINEKMYVIINQNNKLVV